MQHYQRSKQDANGDAAAMQQDNWRGDAENPVALLMIPPAKPSSPTGLWFESPVLITGLPRSGTSMVAGILDKCGLWLGKTVPGGKENAKGFFENILLREKAQKAILGSAGYDPLGVRKLPPPDWRPEIPDFRSGIAKLLAIQGYDGKRRWGFKDAKMTLTWRIWHAHFPRATWIIVRRPSEEVIASCLRTSFMNQHSGDQGYWQNFVAEYQLRLQELVRATPNHFEIESSAIVRGNYHSIGRAVAAVGLEWREDAVGSFVASELWHGSQSAREA